jgi:hypothetical protein
MTTQNLLFTSADQTTLFVTNGSSVTQLADGSSSPAFLTDPIYSSLSATVIGTNVYFTMADSTDTTSAIWKYDGTTVTQVTLSSDYVYNQQDPNAATPAQPLYAYNGDLVFSKASLTSNTAGDNSFDTAQLAIYNPGTGQITQPSTPHGGYDPQDFVTLNGVLYFEARDSTTASEAIYSFDGTTVTEIYNLHPTFSFNVGFNQTVAAAGSVTGPLAVFNNHVYFGSGQQTVEELTSTASLSNSATNVAGSAQYNFGSNPGSDLIVSNNHLFFLSTNNGVYSLDTNNTLTQLVGSIGAQGFTPVVYNNAVYFVAMNPISFQQNLYSSTGSSASVVSANFSGSSFLTMGGTLYYNNGNTSLGTINGSTLSSLAVPGGVGGQPLVTLPFPAVSWNPAIVAPPSVTAGASVSFTGGGSAIALDASLTVADPSSANLASATITIGGFRTGDTLNFLGQNNISGSYNLSTGVLTLAGKSSTANYQSALDSITYSFAPSNGDPTGGGSHTSRTISWVVDDGTNTSTPATSTLNVSHVAPTVAASGNVPFTIGKGGIALDPAVSVSDPDSNGNLTGATVAITGGLLTGDTLGYATQSGIIGSYDSKSGTLTLSGSATLAQYQTALRSITFDTNAADPTSSGADASRTITWTATDGVATSSAVTSGVTLAYAPPVISNTVGKQAATDEAPLSPFSGVTITDPNANQTETVTITLSAPGNGTLSNLGGGNYNALTGVYTVTGTPASVTTAIEGLIFTPTVHQVAPGSSVTTTFTLDVVDSVAATASSNGSSVVATAVNDPPAIDDAPMNFGVPNQDQIAPFTGVSIVDPDIGHVDTVTITLSDPAGGTLSNVGTGSFNPITGIYSVSGSSGQVTSAVQGLVFTPAPSLDGYVKTTGFTIDVQGEGGTASDNSIAVTSVLQVLGLASIPHGQDIIAANPLGSGFPPPSLGHTNEAVVTDPLPSGSYLLPDGYQAAYLGGTAAAELSDLSVGNAYLIGNSGNDTLTAGAGNDTIFGGSGQNQLVASGDSALVLAQSGTDTIIASGGQTTIVAAGTASVSASGASQIVFGSFGEAPPGDLTVSATDGNATISAGTSSLTVTVSGGADLVYGGFGETAGAVSIAATGAEDTIAAGNSSGMIDASGGDELVFGGFDTVNGTLSISVGGSNDTVAVGSSLATVTASGDGALIFGGVDSNAGTLSLSIAGTGDTIAAGASATTITGSGDNALIFGGFDNPAGALTVSLSGAAPTIASGASSADVTVSGGSAWVFGGFGQQAAALAVSDQGSADTIVAGNSAATVSADSGSDQLWVFGGAGGIDFIGGAGSATVVAGTGAVTATGGSGELVMAAGPGSSTVTGGVGATTLFGAANGEVDYSGSGGSLYYAAGIGNETLNAAGSTTNDTIVAGSGSATFSPGSGNNTFLFYQTLTSGQPNNADVISTFTQNDTVRLIGYGADAAATALGTAVANGGGTTITLTDNTTITFLDISNVSALTGHIVSI